jgi:hypothetical protein
MSCVRTQEAITSGAPLSAEHQHHLERCQACRELRDDVEELARLARDLPRPAWPGPRARPRRVLATAVLVALVVVTMGFAAWLSRQTKQSPEPMTAPIHHLKLDLLAALNDAEDVWHREPLFGWTVEESLRDAEVGDFWVGLRPDNTMLRSE